MVRLSCLFSAIGLMLLGGTAMATFMPENDLHLEDDLFMSGGISEEEFDEVLDKLYDIYEPIVADLGGKLKFNRYWNSNTVNASASQSWGSWHVNMYGGLARRSEVTKDGFAMVVCHELGHHLGGFPYSSSWAANEGQSDYLASLSCARLLWGEEDEENSVYRFEVNPYVQELCDGVYENRDRQNLCYRQMAANLSIAQLLAALRGDEVDYQTPDLSEVSRTNNSHPEAQCRLDTYREATLCAAVWDEWVIPESEKESARYSCTRSQGYTVGVRPRCWFKPRS